MTNQIKGEVSFETGGKTYVFKLGTNAQALIEDRVDMSMGQWITEKAENLAAKDIRLIMWAGLFRNHQLSETEVGDLIDEIGIERAGKIFNEAVAAATAKPNGADTSHPRKQAEERIGKHS